MGKPPIRALVCDFEDDYECYAISDQYMFGDSMLIAPMTEQQSGREVYLPKGRWYDLWTNETIEGGRKIYIESNNIPVYVRDNSIVPWAKPVQYISKDTVFEITLKCFGKKGKTVLIQDDGVSCDTKYETVEITFENKKTKSDLSDFTRYKIVDFEYI